MKVIYRAHPDERNSEKRSEVDSTGKLANPFAPVASRQHAAPAEPVASARWRLWLPTCIPRRNCPEHPKLRSLRDNRTVEGASPATL